MLLIERLLIKKFNPLLTRLKQTISWHNPRRKKVTWWAKDKVILRVINQSWLTNLSKESNRRITFTTWQPQQLLVKGANLSLSRAPPNRLSTRTQTKNSTTKKWRWVLQTHPQNLILPGSKQRSPGRPKQADFWIEPQVLQWGTQAVIKKIYRSENIIQTR